MFRPIASGLTPALLAGLLVLAGAASPRAEETALLPIPGERLSLGYEAYKGGFRVMDISIALDLTEAERYRIGLEGELVGAPALLFTYEIALGAEGRMTEAGPAPNRFRIDSLNGRDREPEWLALDYDARGVPQVSGDPLPSEEARPPVSEARRKDALDLLSGLIAVVQQVLAQEGCDLEASIFDGRRRFDVVSADQGLRELPKSSINIFSGTARLCALTVKPIAGYRFDGRDRRTLPELIEAYLAPPAPGLPEMPVRIIAHTGWGSVLVHLVKVKDGGTG